MSMYWWSKHAKDPKSNRPSRRGSRGVPATYEQDVIPFEPSFVKSHAVGLTVCAVTLVACASILGACWTVASYFAGGMMYLILCAFSMGVSLILPAHWYAQHRRLLEVE
jgi:predicted phage tail protein